MIWSILSALACLGLIVRLTFYTDAHREQSRWLYRALLYFITIYAGHVLITFWYNPLTGTNPLLAIFHMAMLAAALVMRPEYLPGNLKHDTCSNQSTHLAGSVPRRPQ